MADHTSPAARSRRSVVMLGFRDELVAAARERRAWTAELEAREAQRNVRRRGRLVRRIAARTTTAPRTHAR